MPKRALYVCSFWVHRPEDYPQAADYTRMLRYLQRSCDLLGLKHIVLTDGTGPVAWKYRDWMPQMACLVLPRSLMRATTEAHAQFLETFPVDGDILFVGADSIIRRDPRKVYPNDFDLSVTYRPRLGAKHPINNGAIYVPQESRDLVAPLFRRVADRCGDTWCDDQRALAAELAPLPSRHGLFERAGLRVRFLPMRPYNDVPVSEHDPARGAVLLHFRGRGHKPKFFPWAERWMQ